ncbi:cell division protein CrgA [Corynebacterium diphtheriae bv. mitis]|uniref:cell division protein CrgA n=1 Tax=Corynebacterium diphtheriae TaxID=1717 RepID=UPI0013C808BD|nr:cell division protein CrgA [Corynebacterium diphtheriae]MBG9276825.1 cell division protein CrgA [Corynebacterium diphtheriae bv. mitis]MBG9281209.1 cell division protein CrgA [Corynebacterium diphtheriae bv. mitis]CAB0885179.1 cell division protein CrgA [Corynebacterium diphtheriae]
MPKSKINHSSTAYTAGSTANRTPVKINSTGTPLWYKIIMFGLILAGLLWLIVNYIAGQDISFMTELGPWNYGIGFGLFIIGLLMTMGWR